MLSAVRDRARRENRTAGEVLSDLARQALTGQVVPGPVTRGRHGFHPFPRRGTVVTNELVDRPREAEDE